jgi:transglutaminase-like putative cysteine protease
VPTGIKVQSRIIGSDVKQMLITIARVNPTPELRISFTVEVERWSITAPQQTHELKIPELVAPELRKYMGVSPYIETSNPLIVKAAAGIGATAKNDWRHVEMIYDWVRKNIRYEFDKELQGALTALRRGKGDCEELTSLFIAICRNHGIPARSVWIPGHCYPEFYLVDRGGNGYWFPAQVAGTRSFGSMPERRPVLQKGDNFRIPGNPRAQRYVAETFIATRYSQPPTVQFFRRQVTASGNSDDPFAPVLK